MSEQAPESWTEEAGATRPGDTGVAEVDQVIEAVAMSEDQPLAEQVTILENGHAALRRALG